MIIFYKKRFRDLPSEMSRTTFIIDKSVNLYFANYKSLNLYSVKNKSLKLSIINYKFCYLYFSRPEFVLLSVECKAKYLIYYCLIAFSLNVENFTFILFFYQ